MTDWPELLVTGLSGLAGAGIGGYFTLKSADRAHEKSRRAAKDDAKKVEHNHRLSQAWKITHAFQNTLATLTGAKNGVARTLHDFGPVDESDLWRALRPARMTAVVESFQADDVTLFYTMKKAYFVNSLYDLEHSARRVILAVHMYYDLRVSLADIYHKQILSGLDTTKLAKIDGRFVSLNNSAKDLVETINREYEKSVEISREFIKIMRPFHDEMGFAIREIPAWSPSPEPNDSASFSTPPSAPDGAAP